MNQFNLSKVTTSCVSREGCVPTQVKTMERPQGPVRHNVARNGKRDGARAEKSQENCYFNNLAG